MRGLLGFTDVERASLWRRLAVMERAGIPIQQSIARVVEQGGEGRVLVPMQAALTAGEDIARAVEAAPALSPLERRIVGAAAKGGQLPEALDDLALHFEERAAIKRALALDLAYPLLIVHLACILPNAALLVSDGVGAFLAASLLPLGVAWGVLVGTIVAWRALRAASPLAMDSVVLGIPAVGMVAKKRALSTSLRVMRMLYVSGVSIIDATEAAAVTCPNAAVGAAFARIRQRMIDGMTIGQAFSTEPVMPQSVLDLVVTGEKAGRLDDLLARAGQQLDDEGKLARRVLLGVLGAMAFLLAAGLVAYKVISFYVGYFDQLNKGF